MSDLHFCRLALVMPVQSCDSCKKVFFGSDVRSLQAQLGRHACTTPESCALQATGRTGWIVQSYRSERAAGEQVRRHLVEEHGVDPADVHVALCCDKEDHNAKLREYGGRGVALLHKDHVCMYSFVTDWVDTAAKLIHARRHRRILYLEADTRLRAGGNPNRYMRRCITRK